MHIFCCPEIIAPVNIGHVDVEVILACIEWDVLLGYQIQGAQCEIPLSRYQMRFPV